MDCRFLLHCHDPRNWRLRDLENHPLDPGWEEGCYVCCHPKIRSLTKEGTRIIDVVVSDKGKPIIRSAFEVTKTEETKHLQALYFDEFHFADGEPIELPEPYIQYRQMTMRTFAKKYPNEPQVWERIEGTYTKYKKGVKPKSIDLESWTRMKEIAAKVKEKHKRMGFGKEKSKCK